ncbi:MAG TPA: hypothetical protein ENN80_13380, partial [Candidatus Hydrogenedentes bacterium]|nr:hypothetical protein [Candidatus Hydrogenedentota bacterium]
MIRVGFGAACITPPLGKEMPGLFEKRYAEGTLDDLFARAVVLDDGRTQAAMVQTDCVFVRHELVTVARNEAQRLCGIPAASCLIAATHTHSGGPVFRGFMAEPDIEYERFVAEKVGSAIAEAHRRLEAAEVGTGTDAAPGVAFNRRFEMRNG